MAKRKTKKKKRRVTFERGRRARAERDIQAKRLKGKEGVDDPFALATFQIQSGARIKNGEVEKELRQQRGARRR